MRSVKSTTVWLCFAGGTFGYLAASASGIGLVKLSDAYGWQSVYLTFLAASFLGGLFFMLTLKQPKRVRR